MSQTFEPQILNHPLIQHKISLMRKKETGSKDFRELASEVTKPHGIFPSRKSQWRPPSAAARPK